MLPFIENNCFRYFDAHFSLTSIPNFKYKRRGRHKFIRNREILLFQWRIHRPRPLAFPLVHIRVRYFEKPLRRYFFRRLCTTDTVRIRRPSLIEFHLLGVSISASINTHQHIILPRAITEIKDTSIIGKGIKVDPTTDCS